MRKVYILWLGLLMIFLSCEKTSELDEYLIATNPINGQTYNLKIVQRNGTSEENKIFFVLPFYRESSFDYTSIDSYLKEVSENLPNNTTATIIGLDIGIIDNVPTVFTDETENVDLFLSFLTTHIDSVLLSRNIYEPTDEKGLIGGHK